MYEGFEDERKNNKDYIDEYMDEDYDRVIEESISTWKEEQQRPIKEKADRMLLESNRRHEENNKKLEQQRRERELDFQKSIKVREFEVEELLSTIKNICNFEKNKYNCDKILDEFYNYINKNKLIDRDIRNMLLDEMKINKQKINKVDTIFEEFYKHEQENYMDEDYYYDSS